MNRVYHQLRGGKLYNPAGTDVFDEDWDTLILLDACRYDVYAALTPFKGTPGVRLSRGSASKQFVRGDFAGKRLHDVVYVSGNQWYLKLREELECELHAYHDVERDAVGGRVPRPQTVTAAALDFADRYPTKRLLVHYMQPHRPYLGKGRDQFVDDSGDGRVQLREIDKVIKTDRALRDDLIAAYRDNLRLVLEDVERLVEELDGKTVISSDHGELLWDRIAPIPIRWYGHPSAIYVDTLVNVPWHVVSEEPRREIVAEPPDGELESVETDHVTENLRDLGYL